MRTGSVARYRSASGQQDVAVAHMNGAAAAVARGFAWKPKTVRSWVHSYAIVGTATLVGLVVTVLALVPGADAYTYRSRPMHTAIETTTGLAALLAAYLVFGRYRHKPRLNDLVTAVALAANGVTRIAFAIPGSSDAGAHWAYVSWTPTFGHVLGALLLAVAAFLPGSYVRRPTQYARVAAAVVGAALTTVAVAMVFAAQHLPAPPDHVLPPQTAGTTGSGTMDATLVVLSVLLAIAAVGYARRAPRERDTLTAWLAGGCVLGAFSRLNYVIFPSMHSSWIYSGDLLRLGFYVLVLIGAVRQIGVYQREAAAAAVAEERRRFARDLHDDVAQDLAYIALQLRLAAAASGREPWHEDLATAAERALSTSRSVISALTRGEQSFEAAIVEVTERVSAQTGVRVQASVDPGLEADPWTVDALSRVIRESVVNAARHGGARNVHVRLARDSGIQLVVSDDGGGFDEAAVARRKAGFGLTSMRERVERLGGTLNVSSFPGRGVVIEVVVP